MTKGSIVTLLPLNLSVATRTCNFCHGS